MTRGTSSFVLALLLLLALRSSAGAQAIWLTPDQKSEIYLEILKPDFEGETNIGFLTTSWYLGARYQASSKVILVGEVPVAYYKRESISEITLGNLYIGVEEVLSKHGFFGEAGLRFPMLSAEADDPARITGFFSDLDRWEAYLEETVSILGMVNWRGAHDSGVGLRFRLGPSLWIPTKQGDRTTEWHLLYAGQLFWKGKHLSAMGGVSGRAWITESEGTFDERTWHQLVFMLNVLTPRVRPGIRFQIPLDEDLQDLLDLVWGVQIEVILG
jgi:hypothetical protein